VAAIGAALAGRGDEPTFQQPSCYLGYSVRTSSHSTNFYSVETNQVEEIDQLPGRLREKMIQNRGL
jgi:hypothetical protein